MLKQIKYIQSKVDIKDIFIINENDLAIVDFDNNINIKSLQNNKTISNLVLKILNSKNTIYSYNKTKNILAIVDESIIYIIDITNNNLVTSLNTTNKTIDVISFSDNGNYIITITKDGRVILYNYKNKLSQLCRIHSFSAKHKNSKYIGCLDMYDDYLVSSEHDSQMLIIKLNSQTNKQIIKLENRINKLIFIDKQTIVCASCRGDILVYKLDEDISLKKISTPFTNIEHLVIDTHKNFAIVGTKSSHTLSLVDIKNHKLIKSNFVTFDAKVKKLLLNKHTLVILLTNNEIIKINILDTIKLKKYIQTNEISQAYKLIYKNPILKSSSLYNILEDRFNSLYMKNIHNLQLHNINKLIEDFNFYHEKKIQLINLKKSFQQYDRFKHLYKNKKYSLLIIMADKFQELKSTKEYLNIKEKMKQDFELAYKYIASNNIYTAKNILDTYITIPSKRELCNLLVRENKDFLIYIKAIEKEEYKTIFKIVKKHKALKDTKEFKDIEKKINHELKDLYNLITLMKPKKITEKITKLQHVPTINSELKKIYNTNNNLQELVDAYNNNNFKKCYELIDTHTLLQTTQLSKFLETYWEKIIYKCELFAIDGDIKSVKTTLDELMMIETRRTKIGDLLRLSFHVKIKQFLGKKQFLKAEHLIYSYIDIFGIDYEIKHIRKEFEKLSPKKLAITMNSNCKISRDNWINSNIV